MSYYEDQEDAWFENNCKGVPSDYDPYADVQVDKPQNKQKGRNHAKQQRAVTQVKEVTK
jgi:hypothetical protein